MKPRMPERLVLRSAMTGLTSRMHQQPPRVSMLMSSPVRLLGKRYNGLVNAAAIRNSPGNRSRVWPPRQRLIRRNGRLGSVTRNESRRRPDATRIPRSRESNHVMVYQTGGSSSRSQKPAVRCR
jgi:hypothetical protein